MMDILYVLVIKKAKKYPKWDLKIMDRIVIPETFTNQKLNGFGIGSGFVIPETYL